MKKIGIMTFHSALNYGAILQAYALQTFLEELDFDVRIVNYRCPFIEKCYRPFFVSDGKYLNAFVRGICFGNTIKLKKKRFVCFTAKYLKLSETYYDLPSMEHISKEYDYFVSGSDQVWSPISANFDGAYFLPFAEDNQKISYAASIGTSKLSDEVKLEMKKRLKGFSCLSVRENSAKALLQEFDCRRQILVHVDPTLLLRKDQWEKLAAANILSEDYILIYNVEKPVKDVEFAKKYARDHKLKIVYINDRTLRKDNEIQYVEAPSPDVFLSLFANAKVIVTNSFHGTVFSVIFKKTFYVELENEKQYNVRVADLLKELKISGRDIGEKNFAGDSDIDWKDLDHTLEIKRGEAFKYFNEVLV